MWLGRKIVNNSNSRFTLIFCAGLVPLVMFGLKMWEVAIDHSLPWPRWFTCGFCRRIDDVSFWSVPVLVMACLGIFFAGRGTQTLPMWVMGGGALIIWMCSAVTGVVAYLYVVCGLEPGTFCTSATGVVWWIHQTEGVLMITLIVVGHMFFALLLPQMIWIKRSLLPEKRRRVLAATVALLGAGLTILGYSVGLIDGINAICQGCPRFPSSGSNPEYVPLFICGVWWPLFPLFVLWLRALKYTPELLGF